MKKKEPLLFVFDVDDTLTQTAGIHIQAFIESLHKLGVKQMDTQFGSYLHHTDSYISKVIYEKETGNSYTLKIKEQFAQLLTAKMQKEKIEEIKGASKLIKSIKAHEGVFACFATGSLRRPAIQKLKAVGIDFEPSLLVASDGIEERENIILKSIEQAKAHYDIKQFGRIISVGDGLWDLKAAKNLQLEFIGIGKKNKAILLANGCKKHVNDFQNIEFDDLLS